MVKGLKIATWNVNSVRSRQEHIRKFISDSDIDVLCIQETKVTDDLFPKGLFAFARIPWAGINGE